MIRQSLDSSRRGNTGIDNKGLLGFVSFPPGRAQKAIPEKKSASEPPLECSKARISEARWARLVANARDLENVSSGGWALRLKETVLRPNHDCD